MTLIHVLLSICFVLFFFIGLRLNEFKKEVKSLRITLNESITRIEEIALAYDNFTKDLAEWGNSRNLDIKDIRAKLHRTIDSLQALIYWQEEMTSPQKGLKTAIAAADRAEIRAKAKEIPDEKAETKET